MKFENHQLVKVLLPAKFVDAHIVAGRKIDDTEEFTVMLDDGSRQKVTVTTEKLFPVSFNRNLIKG